MGTEFQNKIKLLEKKEQIANVRFKCNSYDH